MELNSRSLLAIVSLTGVIGCRGGEVNPEHCWHAAGDATCEVVLGSGPKLYCTTDAFPCGVRAPFGCVSERPTDECYSPCGASRSILEDDECLLTAGGTGDGDGDGDGEDAPPACQNGQLEAGEECDDGNASAGDGCLADCRRPGGVLAELTSFGNAKFGYAVAVGAENDVFVVNVGDAFKLTRFAGDLSEVWNEDSLVASERPNLAVAANDRLLVGGADVMGLAKAKSFEAVDGAEAWAPVLDEVPSSLLAVAAAQTHVVAAGRREAMDEPGLLLRLDPGAHSIASKLYTSAPLSPVAVDASGRVLVVSRGPAPELLGFGPADEPEEPISLAEGVYEDVLLTPEGSVVLLARADDDSSFTLYKHAPDGSQLWTQTHDDAGARGMVLLASGAVLVAGYTSDKSRAVLTWYDGEQGELLYERMDLRVGEEPTSFFRDVAVAPDGEFGVAVGGAGMTELTSKLWIYKFEI